METQLLALMTFTLIGLSTCTVYTARRHQRLAVSPIHTVTFNRHSYRSTARCAVHCKITSACVSVNAQWNSATSVLTCELLGVYLHEAAGSLTSSAGWTFLQEDPVTTDSDWALVFRVTSGIGKNVWDTWHDDGRHDDANEMLGCVLPSSSLPCQSHFRGYLLDRWTNVNQVRLRLYKGGSVVVEMTFNGQGSTRMTWLDKARLLTSSWTDMMSSGANYFSIDGIPQVYRRFYLSVSHGGCNVDIGWLTVADHHTQTSVPGICPWEQRVAGLPVLYFSPNDAACNWDTVYDTADFMMIHVTFTS
ncbi:uncharacterized protein LOC143284987 [Babylonia areolata]|uniref:uncharacterized protein LOC143284987 n=1 Tax=Babylonia areolata TaxID=304850 RepID=UPI003FCF44EE